MPVTEVSQFQRKSQGFLLDLFILLYLMSKPDAVCQWAKDFLRIWTPLL